MLKMKIPIKRTRRREQVFGSYGVAWATMCIGEGKKRIKTMCTA